MLYPYSLPPIHEYMSLISKRGLTYGVSSLVALLLVTSSLLVLPTPAHAATYNIGPGQAYPTFTSLAAGITLQPGDIVDGGGNTFNEMWTINRSGTLGNPIIFRNATVSGQNIRNNGILTNSKSNLTFSNITIKEVVYKGLVISGSTNINIDYLTLIGSGSAIYSTNSSFINVSYFTGLNNTVPFEGLLDFLAPGTDLTVNHVTISGVNKRAIYSSLTANVSLSDIEVTSSTTTVGVPVIEVKNMTSGNLTLDTINVGVTRGGTDAGNASYGININNSDGINLNAQNLNIKNNTGRGIQITDSALLPGSSLKTFDIQRNILAGVYVRDSANLVVGPGTSSYNDFGVWADGTGTINSVIEGVVANYNGTDGIDAVNGVPNWTVRYSEASYNGTAGKGLTTGSGDGFSIHDTSTASFYYNKAIGNLNTGMAHTGSSSGSIYNNTIFGNGSPGDSTMDRAGLYIPTTANPGFIVRNNIIAQNYPGDLKEYSTTSNNNLDYNNYYPINDNNFYLIFNQSPWSWTTYHTTREPHSFNANPLFVNVALSNFKLQSGSPALNTAIAVGLVRDFVGTIVPQGNIPDIGAYELSYTCE
ncbi:MAG: choice-of-anchor Q domain-containing protein [Candidatus Berkelbacteria bacterium]|nr:choice-of-anchor Q domain-containing protein [Candidatus Berkelbacteria bacterium]